MNNMPMSTDSLDLPPALASLLQMPPMQQAPMQQAPMPQAGMLPAYQDGGFVGAEGMPVPPGAVPGMPPQAGVAQGPALGKPIDAKGMEMQINQVAQRHPEALSQIRSAIMEEIQSGELTQQELNTIVQLATVASQNPEMYPYLKQFAMQQGIAAAGDLPDQYDPNIIMVLLLAARAVQQDTGGQNMMQGGSPAAAGGPAIPSMAKGGKVEGKGDSKPVIIEAHSGEYVIPKFVVDMKGKEFFDSLVEKYKGAKGA